MGKIISFQSDSIDFKVKLDPLLKPRVLSPVPPVLKEEHWDFRWPRVLALNLNVY